MTKLTMRRASVQGTKHIQNGINNQDAWLMEEFTVPAFGKGYCVGIVSDGCTNLPTFSRTEVGSNLLVLFAYSRIQEFVCAGAKLEEIPRALFHAITEFVRRLSNDVMPQTVFWGYPMKLPLKYAEREQWAATKRFRVDFMAATLVGFISDGERVVTFSAGDGILIVNDEVTVIDQDDKPEYPASSINSPSNGFTVNVYEQATVRRLAVLTDGPKKLVEEPTFVDSMFTNGGDNPLGLQFLFNVSRANRGELMTDDCTAVTLLVTSNS